MTRPDSFRLRTSDSASSSPAKSESTPGKVCALLAAILAHGCNLGLYTMERSRPRWEMSRLVRGSAATRAAPTADPGGEAEGVPDDHPHYVSRPGSHRDAQADLAGALGRGDRDHPVDAEARSVRAATLKSASSVVVNRRVASVLDRSASTVETLKKVRSGAAAQTACWMAGMLAAGSPSVGGRRRAGDRPLGACPTDVMLAGNWKGLSDGGALLVRGDGRARGGRASPSRGWRPRESPGTRAAA